MVSTDRSVLTLTLNRPDQLNGVTVPMWAALAEVLTAAAGDDAIRVAVVTGSGRAFCAGADLWAEPGDAPPPHPLNSMRATNRAALALHEFPKPTIAKVNGVAAGAGCNMALGCDLIVASDRARFSEIFAKRGLSIDFGGSWILPRLVGMHRAKELVFLADILSADEAQEIGLVNRVVAADELDQAVAELADRLAAGPPLALGLSKKLLNQSLARTMVEALDAEAAAQAINIGASDSTEGVMAFTEKRDPNFTGR